MLAKRITLYLEPCLEVRDGKVISTGMGVKFRNALLNIRKLEVYYAC